ncbi:MAG: NUDIX hydrolase [Chloroflexi bacterium]|nr:NUDIX hydrolase [Chloroflexota bacterium]
MADLSEKRLSSEPAFSGKLVKVYLEMWEQAGGQQVTREIIRHPGAVAMIPLLPNGDVMLVEQFRAAAGRVMLEIPAGTLEPGEDPRAAAVRELQEEIGYKPGKLEKLGGEYAAPGYTSEYIHLFVATELEESRLQQDDDEQIDVMTLPLSEALRRIEQGEIEDSKTIIALLWIARRLGR